MPRISLFSASEPYTVVEEALGSALSMTTMIISLNMNPNTDSEERKSLRQELVTESKERKSRPRNQRSEVLPKTRSKLVLARKSKKVVKILLGISIPFRGDDAVL